MLYFLFQSQCLVRCMQRHNFSTFINLLNSKQIQIFRLRSYSGKFSEYTTTKLYCRSGSLLSLEIKATKMFIFCIHPNTFILTRLRNKVHCAEKFQKKDFLLDQTFCDHIIIEIKLKLRQVSYNLSDDRTSPSVARSPVSTILHPILHT